MAFLLLMADGQRDERQMLKTDATTGGGRGGSSKATSTIGNIQSSPISLLTSGSAEEGDRCIWALGSEALDHCVGSQRQLIGPIDKKAGTMRRQGKQH